MLAVGWTCEIRVCIRVMRHGRLGTTNRADRLAILTLDACHVQTAATIPRATTTTSAASRQSTHAARQSMSSTSPSSTSESRTASEPSRRKRWPHRRDDPCVHRRSGKKCHRPRASFPAARGRLPRLALPHPIYITRVCSPSAPPGAPGPPRSQSESRAARGLRHAWPCTGTGSVQVCGCRSLPVTLDQLLPDFRVASSCSSSASQAGAAYPGSAGAGRCRAVRFVRSRKTA
jgi:hypothetical protein